VAASYWLFRSLDELIRRELVERGFPCNNVLRNIELLNASQALWVHSANHLLTLVDILVVEGNDLSDERLLSLHARNRSHIIGHHSVALLYDVLHALERGAHQLPNQFRPFLDHGIRGDNGLRHAREIQVAAIDADLRSAVPVGGLKSTTLG